VLSLLGGESRLGAHRVPEELKEHQLIQSQRSVDDRILKTDLFDLVQHVADEIQVAGTG